MNLVTCWAKFVGEAIGLVFTAKFDEIYVFVFFSKA
jgi:hypothetical protein